MTIYTHNSLYNSTQCDNTATNLLTLIDDKYLKQIPDLRSKSQLNNVIVGKNNSPDHLAINIYWDTFRSWYRPQKSYTEEGDILHTKKLKTKGIYFDYAKLSKIHGVSKEIIRQKIVKLEGLGLVNRSFQHKETVTTKSFNKLIIYVWQQTPHFFNSCGIDRREITELTPQTNHKYVSKKYNIDFNSNDAQIQGSVRGGVSKQLGDTKELKISFSLEKDRSIKSNFLQNSFFKKKRVEKQIKHSYSPVPLELKDFYPLSINDAKYLQVKSGREFSLNAMNEILLYMSKRVKDRWFKSKKGFLSYMSKVFTYEKRDACKINNENFKIKSNRTIEEVTAHKQEEFLSQIEYSLQVSPEWHLKKKLCSVLERKKAYNLLSSYKYYRIKGGIFEIYLTKQVELTNMDRDIILNQVKASCESVDIATGNFVIISSLKIIILASSTRSKSIQAAEQEVAFSTDIWGKVRQAIIYYYGKDGKAVDKSWFSKLEPEVDEQKKTIKLKAPTAFIRDWISCNYEQVLERYFMEEQYSYVIC